MELEWRTFHAHIWLWLGIPENVYDDWHIHHRKLSKWHRLQFIIDFILYRCQRAAPVLFHRKWTRYCFKGNSNDSYLIHMYIHHIQFVSLIRHSNATHINRTTCTSEFCVKLKVEWKLTVNLKKKKWYPTINTASVFARFQHKHNQFPRFFVLLFSRSLWYKVINS